MPPSLAAALTVTFILWLFYCDNRANRPPTFGLWLATIWIAILGSKPIAAWIYGTQSAVNFETYLDGSPVDRNVLLILLGLGISVLAKRRVRLGVACRANPTVTLFYLFMLLSVIWSVYSFIALKRWIRDAGSIMIILIILSEKDPVMALRRAVVRSAYFLIPLSILTIKYYPAIGVYFNMWTGDAAFRGVTTDKNALGRLAWVCIVFILWSIDFSKHPSWFAAIKRRFPDVLMLLMCAWILRLAESSTSKACALAGVSVLLVSRIRWVRSSKGLLIAGGSAFILLATMFLTVPAVRKVIAEGLGRRADLTDRTEIWVGTMQLGTNPLLGAGFASFWLTGPARELARRLEVTEAHNGYLETYLNGGLIGIGLFFTVLLSAARNTLRELTTGSLVGPLYAAVLLACMLYNITEASFTNTSIVGFLTWLLACRLPRASSPLATASIAPHGSSLSQDSCEAVAPEHLARLSGFGALSARAS